MDNAPEPYVLIDMDCREFSLSQNARRCDFIFFSDGGNLVAPIELKAGKPRASELVNQLQAGAQFAEGIVPQGAKVRLVPVAVYGGRAHRSEINKLSEKSSQIRFRGKSTTIELLKCGRPLVDALKGQRD